MRPETQTGGFTTRQDKNIKIKSKKILTMLTIDLASSHYLGDKKQGFFHGKGEFKWEDNVTFTGDFKLSKIKGKGKYIFKDSSEYEGEVIHSFRHGYGIYRGLGGKVYTGDWVKGKRDGSGVQIYSETPLIKYDGNWKSDQKSGYGTMIYSSGNIYRGYWNNDKRNGYGIMQWTDQNLNQYYIGTFKDNIITGYGEIQYRIPNNIYTDIKANILSIGINMYRGRLIDGKRNGYGTFFYSNGSSYTGIWRDNKKHGPGLFIEANGVIRLVYYEEDKLIDLTHLTDLNTTALSTLNITSTAKVNDEKIQIKLHIEDVIQAYYPIHPIHTSPTLPPLPPVPSEDTDTSPTADMSVVDEAHNSTGSVHQDSVAVVVDVVDNHEADTTVEAAVLSSPPQSDLPTTDATDTHVESSEPVELTAIESISDHILITPPITENTTATTTNSLPTETVGNVQPTTSSATAATAALTDPTILSQQVDIERLLLKYIHIIRTFIQKKSLETNELRSKCQLYFQPPSSLETYPTSIFYRDISTTRNLELQYRCMSIHQVYVLLYNTGIYDDPMLFNTIDFIQCWRDMQKHHK